MKPEGSLPYSQECTIGTYPETNASNPHLPTLFLQVPFYIYEQI